MLDTRTAGLLAAGITAALALGGLGTFLRRLPESATLLPTAAAFALVVAAVVAGVVGGTRGVPGETAYWN